MVKYGKLYREIQLEEFKDNYINYKKLKQKIKEFRSLLPQINNNSISINISLNQSTRIRREISSSLELGEVSQNDNFLIYLKEFKNLLNEEFQRCFNFFKLITKQLHNKLNKHLYTQTNYITYNLDEFIKEVTDINNTIYLGPMFPK